MSVVPRLLWSALVLCGQSRTVGTETQWPTKPKILPSNLLQIKFANSALGDASELYNHTRIMEERQGLRDMMYSVSTEIL